MILAARRKAPGSILIKNIVYKTLFELNLVRDVARLTYWHVVDNKHVLVIEMFAELANH